MATPAVSLREITRRFGGVVANDHVSLDLAPGEIHALVGENGAGKTTLMRVLYGLIQPDTGSIEIDGRPVRLRHPADAMRYGLGMVHQHFMLVAPLTVAENVTLGREPRGALGAYRRAAAEREVATLSERYRLPVDPGGADPCASRSGPSSGSRSSRRSHHGARVLILDEPTAVLTPQEVDELFGDPARAPGSRHHHRSHHAQALGSPRHRRPRHRDARRSRGGERCGGGAHHRANRRAHDGALPSSLSRPRSDLLPLAPLLEVDGLEVRDDRRLPAVKGVSFEVRGGEIVGIAGVEGNGQHELAESLAGLRLPVRERSASPAVRARVDRRASTSMPASPTSPATG